MPVFRSFAFMLLTALVSFAAVQVGAWLGAPNHFVAGVWLSSGLGLVLLLCCGWRYLPAFALGTAAGFAFSPLAFPAGAMFPWLLVTVLLLQSALGKWLAHEKEAGAPYERTELRLLKTGGVAVLTGAVSPVVMMGGVLLVDAMPTTEAVDVALVWWGWNILALVLFSPFPYYLCLDVTIRRHKAGFFLPLLVLVLMAVGFYKVAQTSEMERRTSQFESRAVDIAVDIHRSLTYYQNALESVSLFYRASSHISEEEFSTFARPLLDHFIGMRSLAWAPRVHQDERAAFEARVQKEGLPDYKVWGLNSPFIEQGKRIFFPLRYVESVTPTDAWGFDVASHPARKVPLVSAVANGTQRATAPIELVDTGKLGFLMFSPVYDRQQEIKTEEARWKYLQGLIIAVFHIDDMFYSMIRGDKLEHVNLSIRDMEMPSEVIFQHGSGESVGEIWRYRFVIGGRNWVLEFSPHAHFFPQAMWSPWVLAIGLLIGCFINFALMEMLGRAALVEALVEKRTQELRSHQQALEAAKKGAEKANKTKSSFLASLSHEIRNPLASIIGAADLLKNMEMTDKQKPMVDVVLASGKGLQELVSDVLDVEKIESGKLELETHLFRLHELCEEAVAMTQALLGEKPVTVELSIGADVPAQVEGDSIRLRQVLNNLLGNAAKFTPEGSIRLSVELNQRHDDELELLFVVEDTGIGIPDGQQEMVFEKFTQAHSSRSGHYGGSGLGLAICSELCRLMGGDIGLESTEGEGSRFWFTVQLHACSPARAEDGSHLPDVNHIRFTGARVLLAEDNAVNQRIISSIIDFFGAEVRVVQDGREAVEVLLSAEGKDVDVVLMDCQMPRMGGIEATRILREEGVTIPIVALTGNALISDREQTLAAGMNDYVVKPVRRIDIARILKKWLPENKKQD